MNKKSQNKKPQKIFKTILDNGLTILVHSTHIIPKVSTQLWYNVGSKDEKSGQKGMAHLIEHMIFKGTEKLSESDINLITHKLSGSCNAFTSYDYTGYLFDFPTQNWPIALDILADCMRNCTFKQDLLTSELKAVIQELKMYRDQYSSSLIEDLVSVIFPDHPYHHPIIGYKQDLWTMERATLIDFYKKHYVPNNATLIVVGDIDPQEVVKLAQKQFGSISADPMYTKEEFYHNQDLSTKSITLYRDIAQPFALSAFLISGARAQSDYLTDVLSWIIGSGKGSRLYKKLADQLELVTDISSFVYDFFDYGIFCVYFYPKKVEDIDKIYQLINRELQDIASQGVTQKELQRAIRKTNLEYLSLFENNQKQAGIIGKSYLATGDENYLFEYLNYPPATVASDMQQFVANHLRPTLMHKGAVLSLPEQEKEYWLTLQEESDKQDMKILSRKVRTTLVEPGVSERAIKVKEPKPFNFPKAQKIALKNGLQVLYFNNPEVAKIDLVLELKAKYFYDPDDKQGLGNFVFNMLLEGTKNYVADKLVDELDAYGINFNASPGAISMSMLSSDFQRGLQLLQEILTNALFDRKAVEKVREKINAEIKNYWDNPSQFAGQLICSQVYKKHPLCKDPLGTFESVANIRREDLINFYQRYFSPFQATLAVVGNLEGYDLQKIFKDTLGAWQGPEVEDIVYPGIEPVLSEEINYPINRDQVVLCFAGLSVSRRDPDYDKLLIFDQIFTGGSLGSMSSRLFRLREQSGLFYTIGGSLLARSSDQPGMVFIKTIVSCDRLKEAEQAIKEAINAAVDSISDQELKQARNAIVNSLVDYFESNGQIASAFLFLQRYGLPEDFFDNRINQLALINKEDVRKATERILKSDKLITLRIGRIEECQQ